MKGKNFLVLNLMKMENALWALVVPTERLPCVQIAIQMEFVLQALVVMKVNLRFVNLGENLRVVTVLPTQISTVLGEELVAKKAKNPIVPLLIPQAVITILVALVQSMKEWVDLVPMCVVVKDNPLCV